MTVLYATGTTGTIGKHLASHVLPTVVDLSSGKDSFRNLKFDPKSNLLHLAGVVGASEVLTDVEYARSVNVRGTSFLAQEFIEKSNGVFYYISTSHVYAPSKDLILESNPLAPANIYAEQKLEAENSLRKVFSQEPQRLCIIRVFSVLDWDAAPYTLGGAIKKLINSDTILANCSDVRDFLTPKSIAQALFEIARDGKQVGVLNLCSGVGLSVGDAAKRMLSESGLGIADSKFSWGFSANPYVVGDNSRLVSLHPTLNLSWRPSTLS